ncbi:hypothetical protein [Geomesophilobacter sediminis]|uniref:Uncharacterized protein n=1 Tax=Geomesophilobacter sediminis TaxID=2798584 RepID=A0A8J7M3Q5_9BACT|nr:hypothetical protein [Geomesophilobacter sediminis]MBJ6728019.1 hypothetical protein [Geomesophilobacter sediminis]
MINFIDDVMRESAQSLGRSLDSYWPTKVSGTCDIPERNVSLHCAIALANRGLGVFQELAFPHTEKSQRLDVLAIAPGHSFALYLEFKAYTGASMDASTDDLDRVKQFSLNRVFDPKIFGLEFVENLNSLDHEVGIVAGALWRPSGGQVELAGPAQKRFAAKVETLGGVVCREPHLIRRYTPERNPTWDGAYYLYWAVVGDWQRKMDVRGILV